MKMMQLLKIAAITLGLVSGAHASFVDQGDGTVLDTASNLLWLKDWSSTGQGNWNTQLSWAESLTFAGNSDWELPTNSQYTDLSANSGATDLSSFIANTGFTNVRQSYYWSSTAYSGYPLRATKFMPWWFFSFNDQSDPQSFAVAVRPADLTSPIPEPETYALMLVGLAVMGDAARRRKTKQEISRNPLLVTSH